MLPIFHIYVCIKWFGLKYMSLVFAFCDRFYYAHIHASIPKTSQVTDVMVAADNSVLFGMSHLYHHHFIAGYKILPG